MSALNHNQYQLLAEKLHARRNELLEDIMVRLREQDSEIAQELDEQLNRFDDDAVAQELLELKLDDLQSEIEKLRGVQNAERRLQAGTYGECVDCHRNINADKLQMQPSASRCNECEERRKRGEGSSEHSYH